MELQGNKGFHMLHKEYLLDWEKAMKYGLMNGRPFSEDCVKIYVAYIKGFLDQYEEISVNNLKQILLTVPIEKFSKRLKIHQAVCCFAKYLVEQGELTPEFIEKANKIKPKRHLPPKKITVTEDEIESLLKVCKNPLDRFIVEILSQTGLRASEATNLLLNDVDLERGFLVVRLAKWGKTRKVGLTNRAQESIQAYLHWRPESPYPNLLLNGIGKPIARFGLRDRLEKLGNRAKVKVSPHALRRAFVTINANKGRPLPMLQIACGHSDITTTRSYCLTSEDETIEAMKNW